MVRSKTCPTRAVMPRATMMAAMDSPTGIRAAAIVPKRTMRIMRAMGRPTRSPLLRSLSDNSLLSWAVLASPTKRTRKPSFLSASSTTWRTSGTLSTASSKEPVMITAKNVVLRSSEMGGGAAGLKSGGRATISGPRARMSLATSWALGRNEGSSTVTESD